MKSYSPCKAYPKVYQAFKNTEEIGKTINRSQSYVKKHLKTGFTQREREMLNDKAQRELFQ